jgi:hypothetical protein
MQAGPSREWNRAYSPVTAARAPGRPAPTQRPRIAQLDALHLPLSRRRANLGLRENLSQSWRDDGASPLAVALGQAVYWRRPDRANAAVAA